MKPVISPGDRVLVTPYVKGYARKPYKASVIDWTPRGKLKVKADRDGRVIVVSSEHVKKVADGQSD
ncbi:hypothetical protein [Spirosoma sp. 48-14]|uniref:hypothetical protein n=1 Tax=Spirosoma sp. 48-14 TaxID=1895854 RepID=UPI000960BEFB|nr:hypothetical protein [Spirosoma sp. 48-14]OJW75400.1 MAG: hypothetical protein BGO59_19935 [Spirosoma sp. 48-14]